MKRFSLAAIVTSFLTATTGVASAQQNGPLTLVPMKTQPGAFLVKNGPNDSNNTRIFNVDCRMGSVTFAVVGGERTTILFEKRFGDVRTMRTSSGLQGNTVHTGNEKPLLQLHAKVNLDNFCGEYGTPKAPEDIVGALASMNPVLD